MNLSVLLLLLKNILREYFIVEIIL